MTRPETSFAAESSLDQQYESGIRRASYLLLALAAAGEPGHNNRVRNYCIEQLRITGDDEYIARERAKEDSRLRFRVTHFELAAGAFPATVPEQATIDYVQTVIDGDRALYEAAEPLAYDIYTQSMRELR